MKKIEVIAIVLLITNIILFFIKLYNGEMYGIIPQTIEIFKGLTPIITLIIMSYIAWKQYEISKNKLKLDSYDRRNRIVKIISKCLIKIAVINKYPSLIDELIDSNSDSIFLFNKDINEYLKKIIDNIQDVYYLQEDYEQFTEEKKYNPSLVYDKNDHIERRKK